MPDSNSFRQVDEKHVSTEVHCMAWSPKMDLLAVANIQGEVVLHRLSWQKVWTLTPASEELKVSALAWRPDGKVLAVGGSNGRIQLCDVENSSTLHTITLPAPVTSLSWGCEATASTKGENPDTGAKDCFLDESTQYLPPLPAFSKNYGTLGQSQVEENVEDSKKLKGQTDLNVLVVGTAAGAVLMFAFGVFPMGTLDLNKHCSTMVGYVLSAKLSDDLHLLSLLADVHGPGEEGVQVHYMSFDTTLLASRHQELRLLAQKFGHVFTLLSYLKSTIQQMSEAWEDILTQMDSKLVKFAEEKQKASGGSISNDLLRLLMFGTPSFELQNFLLHDVTDKGLKKLGHSIESSYSNIQKLVLKHLQSVGQALLYHLSDLKGMSQWYDRFGVLGLSTSHLQEALSLTGSFILKANELQQVINGSMKNFKAFFRWLYVVIQRLCDEPIPPELSKMTQQDLNYIAQFLNENFTDECDPSKSGFKLEKVGQYLQEKDLHDPPPTTSNPWMTFISQHPQLQESGIIYKCYNEKSLIQVNSMMTAAIKKVLDKCALVTGTSLQCVSDFPLHTLPARKTSANMLGRVSQLSKVGDGGSHHIYTAFTTEPPPCQSCFLLRQTTRTPRCEEIACVHVGELGLPEDANDSNASCRCSTHAVLDLSFYDSATLSLLLQQQQHQQPSSGDAPGCPVLAQAPLTALQTAAFHRIDSLSTPDSNATITQLAQKHAVDMGVFIDQNNWRPLENMKAAMFAVSGTRKVSCVLFSSRRRVRLFLMDVEDDDDDDDDDKADESMDRTGDVSHDSHTDDLLSSPIATNTGNDGDDEDKENTSRESTGMDL